MVEVAAPDRALDSPDDDRGTTLLGPWYATVLFWRPRVTLLTAHRAPASIIDQERQHMRTVQRRGRVPYLEQVTVANLPKITTAMRIFRLWAESAGLRPSETVHVSWTRDRR